ncbi:PiggyBac transposable element-derived protein 5, partial [Cryomyces antarcticus]
MATTTQTEDTRDLPNDTPAYPINVAHNPELCLPPGTDASDPKAIFDLFFPQTILDEIATNTNLYAAVQRRKKGVSKAARAWKPTTAAELRVFLGIL